MERKKFSANDFSLGNILHENTEFKGITFDEAYAHDMMIVMRSYPRYRNHIDLMFDKICAGEWKYEKSVCPKCGSVYLKDNTGYDGCLECGYHKE